jgi:hypothetical protein
MTKHERVVILVMLRVVMLNDAPYEAYAAGQHTSAYVSVCCGSAYVSVCCSAAYVSIRQRAAGQHTSAYAAYVSIHAAGQHTSAYVLRVSIRQHTSAYAYVSIRLLAYAS